MSLERQKLMRSNAENARLKQENFKLRSVIEQFMQLVMADPVLKAKIESLQGHKLEALKTSPVEVPNA